MSKTRTYFFLGVMCLVVAPGATLALLTAVKVAGEPIAQGTMIGAVMAGVAIVRVAVHVVCGGKER